MFKLLKPISVAALIATAAPLAAQDTETATEDTQAPATADQLLDLGEPVAAGPRLGERYSKEKHGDWDLACIKTEAEVDPCSLLQIMTDDNGNPMAEFSLFRLAEGGQAVAGATVVVPLETLLPAQLTISVDGAPGKRYNYTFCSNIGCVAQIGFTEADVTAFKQGGSAKITLRPAPAPEQVVELDLSLKGFTAGFDIVDVVSQ
ncbi:MAG: invasion associated locus B family protein [Rhodobacteraceae bacterium]|nr:invasion associated locus B family protein [Paracoccaceae bacterium]